MSEFSGKIAIVTGGTSGIGRAISAALLDEGATVVALYGGNDAKAQAFKKDISNDKLETVKVDISDHSAIESFFKEFEEKYKELHILVNCAGIREDSIVGMMNIDNWHKVIETNLTGTFSVCKFATLLMMRKRYGRIINITSPSGRQGIAGQANYSSSKAGQVAFTKSLARETAKRNITVNCVSPGFIDTEFIADLSDDLRKNYEQAIPLKRFGKPEEVAPAVLYLAGERGSYITGTVLEVTGGL